MAALGTGLVLPERNPHRSTNQTAVIEIIPPFSLPPIVEERPVINGNGTSSTLPGKIGVGDVALVAWQYHAPGTHRGTGQHRGIGRRRTAALVGPQQ